MPGSGVVSLCGSTAGAVLERLARAPERGAAFSVQPNPARDHVVLRYDFGGPAPHARAVLRDPGGRILQDIQLRGGRGQQHLTLADLANGSYVIQYFSGEQLVHSERFVVQR